MSPDLPARPPVLVLRALGIGDLATAVPALRGIRAAYPGEEIVLAAPGWLAPLAELTGAVDRVVPVDGLRAPGIAVPSPGLAVNLHGRGPESHRLLAGTRPGRMLGFACPGADFSDGPQWSAEEHEVRRWCRLLDWYGIATRSGDLALHRPAVPPPVAGVTIVHPGAKDPARRWPAGRFAEVARGLARDGHDVVITGTAAERWLADRVASLAGLPADRALAGVTDVAGLAAMVAHARLVVCNDTGVGHLATGYRIPSVVLFGPTRPACWGPLVDQGRHRVLWHGVRDRPRRAPRAGWRPPHPALGAISVAEVLAAVRDVVAQDHDAVRDHVVAQDHVVARDHGVAQDHGARDDGAVRDHGVRRGSAGRTDAAAP
jgi:ADP-heptose:LPS heptosyltransferase